MDCIPASRAEPAKLNDFFKESNLANLQGFLKNGYVVMVDHLIIGCFELELIGEREYWLKQLYIIQKEAAKLPALLEYILILAKEKEAAAVYAHSDQPVTDLLLKSMCFTLHTGRIDLLKQRQHGQWWTYKVS